MKEFTNINYEILKCFKLFKNPSKILDTIAFYHGAVLFGFYMINGLLISWISYRKYLQRNFPVLRNIRENLPILRYNQKTTLCFAENAAKLL